MKLYKPFLWAVILAFFILGCAKSKSPQSADTAKAAAKTELTAKETARELEEKEINFLFKELRQKNPFHPEHVSSTSRATGYSELKGIVWDNLGPYAIIGDRVVMEGDFVDGRKVLKINKDSIELDNNGEKQTLKLKK